MTAIQNLNAQFYELKKRINEFGNPSITYFERPEGYWSHPSEDDRKVPKTIKEFFQKLTKPKSQRENWYKVTPYIAEFWCTLSNVGFFYVGAHHKCPELIFAGAASAVSHAIPKQWLLTVDKIALVIVLLKFASEYKTIISHPELLVPIAIAGIINLTDSYLARKKGATWPHVVWHLSSAFLAYIVLNLTNTAIQEV